MRLVLPLVLVLAVAAGSANAAVLFDQIGPIVTLRFGVVSQDFDTPSDALDVVALDDFTLLQPATLTSVEAVITGYSNPPGSLPSFVQSWQVGIFSSAAATTGVSRVGDVANFTGLSATAGVISGFNGSSTSNFDLIAVDLTASNLTLAAGTYWLGISGRMDGSNGYLAVTDSALVNGAPFNARQINPGGGFGFTNQPYSPPANLAYRINGVAAVPEPATLAALGLGAVGVLRRRRR